MNGRPPVRIVPRFAAKKNQRKKTEEGKINFEKNQKTAYIIISS